VLHKEIPFLRMGLPLCAGIISGLYIKPDGIILLPAVLAIIAGFSASIFFNKYQANYLYGFTLSISLYICGFLLYANEKNKISLLKPEQSIFCCTLSEYPDVNANSFRLKVKLNSLFTGKGFETIEGSMILYYKKDSMMNSFTPGDILFIKCTPVEISKRGNPYEFDYSFFMENQGIRYYAFCSAKSIISHHNPVHRKLVHRALIIREKIIGMYKARGITGERLALVAAITLGQKNMLDPEQKQNFIKAGVMHIMAVSGLHAVILSLFVFNLLFFLKKRFNILRISITILILWSFAFVTGLTPSVLRATIMFSFLQTGNLMKRRVNGINSVLASAFVLILIKPSVIFDAGFLLSYTAVIYIICFYQDFYLKLQLKKWLPDKVWQSAAVTIVAQAGTLPLTIMLFNRFPTYFLITNIIIVPLSSLLIITGCIVPMVFPIHFLSWGIALLLNYLTWLTEYLTAQASSLPYSTIESIGMTSVECIFLTLAVFLFLFFFLKKKQFSIIFPVFLLFLYVTTGTVKEISTRTTNELIVYNTPGEATVGIRCGKILNLFSDTTLIRPEVLRHCSTLGLKIRNNNTKYRDFSIIAGDKRITICSSLQKVALKKNVPDILIITGTRPEIKNSFFPGRSPEAIIITSEAALSFKIPQYVNVSSIDTIHFVRKSGAFIKRI
jgi:competence protein ComEC